jgi:carbonic anhydrase
MRVLQHLFENNRSWSQDLRARDPRFFERLERQQAPELFWIGCSDSRVPANQLLGLLPGELFVHRNVANVVVHADLNCLAATQFAVDVLKVRHVIVCGHYGCSGVQAALDGAKLGLADNWLRHVQDVRLAHEEHLQSVPAGAARAERLCELNVIAQAVNVCQTTIVQDAWARGQELSVHGWIYRVADGLLHDLGLCVVGPDEVAAAYRDALRAMAATA